MCFLIVLIITLDSPEDGFEVYFGPDSPYNMTHKLFRAGLKKGSLTRTQVEARAATEAMRIFGTRIVPQRRAILRQRSRPRSRPRLWAPPSSATKINGMGVNSGDGSSRHFDARGFRLIVVTDLVPVIRTACYNM